VSGKRRSALSQSTTSLRNKSG